MCPQIVINTCTENACKDTQKIVPSDPIWGMELTGKNWEQALLLLSINCANGGFSNRMSMHSFKNVYIERERGLEIENCNSATTPSISNQFFEAR